MTDDTPGLNIREQLARIDRELASRDLMVADRRKREQDIRLALWPVIASTVAATAALIGAGVALAKLLG